jgi:hypothetical protein
LALLSAGRKISTDPDQAPLISKFCARGSGFDPRLIRASGRSRPHRVVEVVMNEELRNALATAVQILKDLPEEFQPTSNIEDMEEILAGRSSGRDGYIMTEAVATALAWHTYRAIRHPLNPALAESPADQDTCVSLYNVRISEFADLLTAALLLGPKSIGALLVGACGRIARVQDQ